MSVIGIKSFSLDDAAYLYDGQGAVQGNDVLMASGQSSSITPTYRHPPGTVLIKKTGDGKYYVATDQTNSDSPSGATVTALETADDDWEDSTITLRGHWGTLTVTLATTDDTDAEVVSAINAAIAAVAPEQGPVISAVVSNKVVVTNRDVGSGTWLHVLHNGCTTAFGATGTDDTGDDPDVRVSTTWVDLQDLAGTAADGLVPTLTKGRFRTASLSSLTAEARGVLERRGSTFH